MERILWSTIVLLVLGRLVCHGENVAQSGDKNYDYSISNSFADDKTRLALDVDSTFDSTDQDSLCPRSREEAAARGRQCLRKCRTDKDCISSKKRCLCDGLCGWSCVRPDLNCEAITPIKNGNFIVSGDHFGAKVTYSCNAGFIMSGPRERTCQGDGSWSGQSPQCREKAICGPPPIIPYARHNGPSEQVEYLDHAIVHYSCFPGYDLNGFPKSQCLYFNGSTHWYGPDLKCIPRSCGHPGDVANGNREGNQFTFKSKVTYSCNEGFMIEGRANRYCQSSGVWSGMLPKCIAIECDKPLDPGNGKAIYSSMDFQSTVTYECRYGFKLFGPQSRVCGPNREWVGEEPKCLEIDCGSPGSLYQGHIEGSRTTPGSAVQFKCHEDMALVGSSRTAKCLENGTWSAELPRCMAPCLVPDILNGRINNIAPGSKVQHGTAINATCRPLYELHYTASPSVCNNGTWTHLLKCIPARCKQLPEKPKNGIVLAGKTDHGSKAIYKCLDGYTLVGSNETFCHLGKWTKWTPKCEEVHCPFPGSVEHGRVLLVGHMGNYDYRAYVKRVLNNKQIVFECDKGHSLDGPPGSTCIDGKWSPKELPKCEKNFFPTSKLMEYRRRKRSWKWTENQFRNLGKLMRHQRAKASCHSPNNTPWMDATIIRLASGNGSYPHGTIIQVNCVDGYVLSSGNNSSVRCSRGLWRPRLPSCIPAPCQSLSIENAFFTLPDRKEIVSRKYLFKHGDSVEIKCKHPFQLRGAGRVDCWRGRWSQSLPVCMPNSCKLPTIVNGHYVLQFEASNLTIYSGEQVTYKCNNSRTEKVIACENGFLRPESATCPAAGQLSEDDEMRDKVRGKGLDNIEQQVELREEKFSMNEMMERDKLSEWYFNESRDDHLQMRCSLPENNDQIINFIKPEFFISTTSEPERSLRKTWLEDEMMRDESIQINLSSDLNLTVSEVNSILVAPQTQIVHRCVQLIASDSPVDRRITWTVTCEQGEWIARASPCDEDAEPSLDDLINATCVFRKGKTVGSNVISFVNDRRAQDGDEFPPESELVSRCIDIGKYSFHGSFYRKCLFGHWNGSKPECVGLSQEHGYALERAPTILIRHSSGSIAQSNDGKLIVFPGTTVHLECLWIRKFGKPTWTLNDAIDSDHDQGWTEERGRDSTLEYRLTIKNAFANSSGKYTCITPNKYRHSIEIIVRGW